MKLRDTAFPGIMTPFPLRIRLPARGMKRFEVPFDSPELSTNFTNTSPRSGNETLMKKDTAESFFYFTNTSPRSGNETID